MKNIIAFSDSIGCRTQENVPMKSLTSFKIGGPAEVLVYPQNEEQLSKLVSECCKRGIKPFILGNGSNLLVSDDGIDGVVIAMSDIDYCRADGDVISCGAGLSLKKLCMAALDNSLKGLEFAYGIPGSVGGAVFMNAGAYGGEIKDVLETVTYITPDGKLCTMPASQAELGYRKSIFSSNGCIVVGASVKLEKGDSAQIKKEMNDILGRRKDKQPLQYPSAGSVFKRPEGYFAGALIEQCGLKGKTIGGAQVSEKHAGFIINIGSATSEDVDELIKFIQKTVLDNTGVMLETEVRYVPEG